MAETNHQCPDFLGMAQVRSEAARLSSDSAALVAPWR
jgi:hypothetical protein